MERKYEAGDANDVLGQNAFLDMTDAEQDEVSLRWIVSSPPMHSNLLPLAVYLHLLSPSFFFETIASITSQCEEGMKL